jgi:putative hydrolase of the HAD superfamily
MQIDMIAFDADDTLWENELLYQEAQKKLKVILSPWQSFQTIDRILYETEQRNMPIYGYGIKAFTLSMIETAIRASDSEISGHEITQILNLGHSMLTSEVALHPYARETLETLTKDNKLMMITKGDLLDQSAKIERSGLTHFFDFIEIVNDKTIDTYIDIIKKYDLDPKHFLMVGNSLRSDVQPILELGGKAVYIPADITWEHEIVPDFDGNKKGFFQLEHLGQLPDLITKLKE